MRGFFFLFPFSSDETLQDVAETEIESNWDQVVDKLVILRDLQAGGKI